LSLIKIAGYSLQALKSFVISVMVLFLMAMAQDRRSRSIATEGRHIFQSRKRKRRFFLAEASTTFIAYLYKPEAQAKVLQIPVYYLHIIPSLALQVCKTIDTLRVGFYIRRSLWTKERAPFDKLRDQIERLNKRRGANTTFYCISLQA